MFRYQEYLRKFPENMRQRFLPTYSCSEAGIKLKTAGIQFGGISCCGAGFELRRLAYFHFLIATVHGEGALTVDGREIPLPAGTIALAPPMMPHFYRHAGEETWQFLWFHLIEPHWISCCGASGVCSAAAPCLKELMEVMNGVIKLEMIDRRVIAARSDFPLQDFPAWGDVLPDFSSEEECERYSRKNVSAMETGYAGVLLQLLDYNLKSLSLEFPPPEENPDRLTALWRQLVLHPESPWNLEKMAEFCGMSVASLIRHVRCRYYTSPMKMLQKLRLAKAGQLLLNSSCSINEIARSVGYENFSAFFQAFRLEYGCSPREYRRALNPQVEKSRFRLSS